MSRAEVEARAHNFRVRNSCHLSDWEMKIAEEFYMMGKADGRVEQENRRSDLLERDRKLADQLEKLHQSTYVLNNACHHLRYGRQ